MTAPTPVPSKERQSTVAESLNSAMARKRRREILSSQRANCVPLDGDAGEIPASTKIGKVTGAVEGLSSDLVSISDDEESGRAKAVDENTSGENTCVSATEISCDSDDDRDGKRPKRSKMGGRSCEGEKKPQMRYDPDVPMSKDEAAAWRREQRRKRNRESAAASRQKQRDRIAELEVEVDEWKKKFEDAMDRLQNLEAQLQGASVLVDDQDTTKVAPSRTEPSSLECQVPSSSLETVESGAEEKHHLFEKISRQAAKIAGDAAPPSPFSTSSEICYGEKARPDVCGSLDDLLPPLPSFDTAPAAFLEGDTPLGSSDPVVSSDDDADADISMADLDAFLIDAAGWL